MPDQPGPTADTHGSSDPRGLPDFEDDRTDVVFAGCVLSVASMQKI
jgi:hypothetical protein